MYKSSACLWHHFAHKLTEELNLAPLCTSSGCIHRIFLQFLDFTPTQCKFLPQVRKPSVVWGMLPQKSSKFEHLRLAENQFPDLGNFFIFNCLFIFSVFYIFLLTTFTLRLENLKNVILVYKALLLIKYLFTSDSTGPVLRCQYSISLYS